MRNYKTFQNINSNLIFKYLKIYEILHQDKYREFNDLNTKICTLSTNKKLPLV